MQAATRNAERKNSFFMFLFVYLRNEICHGFVPRFFNKLFAVKVYTVNLMVNKKLMGILNQIAEYLYLKKKDPDAPKSTWVRYMHGINRISILLFLLGLIILAIKLLR